MSYSIHNGRTVYHRVRWGGHVWYPALALVIMCLPLPAAQRLKLFLALYRFALPVDANDPRNEGVKP